MDALTLQVLVAALHSLCKTLASPALDKELKVALVAVNPLGELSFSQALLFV